MSVLAIITKITYVFNFFVFSASIHASKKIPSQKNQENTFSEKLGIVSALLETTYVKNLPRCHQKCLIRKFTIAFKVFYRISFEVFWGNLPEGNPGILFRQSSTESSLRRFSIGCFSNIHRISSRGHCIHTEFYKNSSTKTSLGFLRNSFRDSFRNPYQNSFKYAPSDLFGCHRLTTELK